MATAGKLICILHLLIALTMETNLKLLHLEDEDMDIFLVRKVLERSGMSCSISAVSDRDAFTRAISNDSYDAILADNSLPQFSGMEALAIIKEKQIGIPFILITGTVSEEFSVNAMKEGAWDYVLKDRLQRLPSAVSSAVERHRAMCDSRRYMDEVIAKQAAMNAAEKLAKYGSWQANLLTGVSTWSDQKYRMLGYEPGSVTPGFDNFLVRVHPEDRQYVIDVHEDALAQRNSLIYECRLLSFNDEVLYARSEFEITRTQEGEPAHINGFVCDITESRTDKVKLQESEQMYRYLFTHNPLPAWLVDDATMRFLEVNNAATEYFGFTRDEFMGMELSQILSESEWERAQAIFSGKQRPSQGIPQGWKQIKKDGSTVEVDMLCGEVWVHGRPAHLSIIVNRH